MNKEEISQKLMSVLRQVPDFPKPGINFYDITTLLKSPQLTRDTIHTFQNRYCDKKIDAVVAVEARGFIFGALLSSALNLPFIPVRKPGKLPAETESISYALEYGEDSLEIHKDALDPDQHIVIIDDLLATGGTASATVELCQKLGAKVLECAFVIELSFLNGRQRIPSPVFSLIRCDH